MPRAPIAPKVVRMRELDDLAAARGIALGSLYGVVLWALLALSVLRGAG
jgi:hypothetical protein